MTILKRTETAHTSTRSKAGAAADVGASFGAESRPVLGRLLRLCWEHRAACAVVVCFQLALLSLGLLGLGLTGVGIDYLRETLEPGAASAVWPFGLAPPETWRPMEVLGVLAGIVVAAAVARGGLSWGAGLALAHLVHRKIVGALQRRVYAKLQRLSLGVVERQNSGAIINRATGDIQAVRTFVDTVLIQSLVTVISIGVYTLYMWRVDPWLTASCLATLPVLWIACIAFSRVVHPLYAHGRALFDRMITELAEIVEGVQTVKGLAREREARERFERANAAVQDHQRRIFWRVSTFSPAVDLLTQISLVVLLVHGGWLVIEGRLALGSGLIVFAGLLQQFSNQVSTVAQIANGVQESLAGARRVFEIIDAPLEVTDPEQPVSIVDLTGDVRFVSVNFGYGTDAAVLRDVDFHVPAGSRVALVGATGSGKSALLGLIPRFADPQSGSVRVDGHDVRRLPLDLLRRHVGVVFQESFLFSDTVAANIAFGRPEATREDIVRAAKIAAAHAFVEALPDGYDTVLGEGGVDLSGGQRQRLAIARAILTDPAILLLDDPTAAIDPETEHEILEAIERAIAGRTTFIVAHRLGTLQRADLVLVLERGRIVQRGTHDALMRTEGIYRRAALLQMEDEESREAFAEHAEGVREEEVVS
ncbi:hypothetical protein ASA1KI_35530 [Opitutales bacterium ASA1]|uniref:ABC transporter ATP-binding protein n=1 Tax=Congregicoccus parvus TaxID=3081749 RepID=UPI002B3211B8|nr:hypothetical protein ASA1KI_35530 [Opitutales bacterium ASA1]